jgi:hypothetical protein
MITSRSGETINLQVQDYLVKEHANSRNPREKFKFAGSGDFHFFEMIAFHFESRAGQSPHTNAVGTVIGRSALSFFKELMSNEPHYFSYGGGFEVITLSEYGLTKLPLSHVIWAYDHDGIYLVGPIFSQSYNADGVLVLRRFRRPRNNWLQEVFIVKNFLNTDQEITVDKYSIIDTPWVIHYFLEISDDTKPLIIQQFGPNKNITVDLRGSKIVANITPEFFRLFGNARARFDEARRAE